MQADMRRLLPAAAILLVFAGLASCAAMQSSATKIDDRTYKIEGPGVPGGAEAPNRRTASRICPGGYRVLDSTNFKRDPGEGTYTNWVIRCL
jgi:hypothetical protein